MTLAFGAMAAALSMLLAAGAWVTAELMEERSIRATLETELEEYVRRYEESPERARLPHTSAISAFVGERDGLPAELVGLGPGVHEIAGTGRELHVLVADRLGHRFVLTYDSSETLLLEGRLLVLLVAGVLGFSYAATWCGFWLSGKVISPVSTLADRLRALPAEASGAPIAGEFADDEVGMLARVFDDYRERIHALVEREKAFASDASHELRTSLTVMSGHLDLLGDERLPEPAQARLEQLRRAVAAMGRLLDAFLLLAREPGTGPADSSCDAVEVIDELIAQRRKRASGVAVGVEAPATMPVAVPAAVLGIVIGNLLDNALAHSGSSEVAVAVDATGVTVSDRGAGIPADELPSVFERGFRGRASGGNGSGLGLAIARRLCERYGLALTLDSVEGEGTRARVAFPGRRRAR